MDPSLMNQFENGFVQFITFMIHIMDLRDKSTQRQGKLMHTVVASIRIRKCDHIKISTEVFE